MTLLVGLAAGKSMLTEKELVRVAISMPKAEFLRITRKLTRDISGSAIDLDLCTTTPVVLTPVLLVRQENEEPGPSDGPLLNDFE